MNINILFPVLNEHKRLRNGIEGTVKYMQGYLAGHNDVGYTCTILDNGSDDDTPQIGRKLEDKYPGIVRYVRIEQRGVGIAFRTGVEQNEADIVGYMDIDLSTDINTLGKAIDLFRADQSLEYINGTRFAKESKTIGRKWYRKITSAGLVLILKVGLHMKATDGICGFTFMRRDVAVRLVREAGNDKGWFYMIELLLRAERAGINILDLPVVFTENYDTTVNIGKTIRNYIFNIRRLRGEFYGKGVRKNDKKNRP
ncbi:MAG: glycosyltransferase [Lachnospiraceae bacterium]|nr:glycosyltransferase [Lachnospiraceae bacterium]